MRPRSLRVARPWQAYLVLLLPVGVWEAKGYGTIWEITADSLQSWEVTTTTCVRAGQYARASVPPPGTAEGYLEGVTTAWIIRPGWSRRRLVAHSPGTAADVHFRKLAALPHICVPPTRDTQDANFEAFQRTMGEQYAFFGLRGVNWGAAVTKARRKMGGANGPRAFYDILEEMVAPLDDRHTDVTATDLNVRARHYRHSGGPLDQEMFIRLKANPPTRYLVGPVESWCQDWIQYGELRGSIGYLRILREYTYASTGRFEDDSIAAIVALDSIIPRAARLHGLVIDVRLNGGGFDAIALLIASRLTGSPYLAFRKQTRSDPKRHDRFTPLQPVHVRPSPGARYPGPAVLLTGPYTLSAGEVFTLALLNRRPRIARLGEATQGIFADELLRQLPNGWRFQLSTERYLTPEGKNFEARGIPPDRRIPLFPPADQETGRDGALEAALELLGHP